MSPVPARATLVELPSRANSIARKPDHGEGATLRATQPNHLIKPQPSQQFPTIKKDKTRSRVWGLLGIKGKKSKDVLAQEDNRAAPAANILQRLDTLTPSKRQSSLRLTCVQVSELMKQYQRECLPSTR